MLRQIFVATSCFLFISCNVDTFSSDRYADEDSDRELANTECEKNKYSGCLQGQISSALDISVDNKNFFDADELVARFAELLKVEDKDGNERNSDEFELSWSDSVDNENFAKGFRVYIKGELADDKSVLRNGSFVFNRLPRGVYDVRAQRLLKVELIPTAQAVDASNESEEAEETSEVTEESIMLCLVLFAEDSVEVRKSKRSSMMIFDDFDLEVKQCGESKPTNTVVY